MMNQRQQLTEHLEKVIYGLDRARRFTQDSPVLPDVWIHFGLDPLTTLDLLLTPHCNSKAGTLSQVLRERLTENRKKGGAPGPKRPRVPNVAHTQGIVAAELYFDELIRVVLPRTYWWKKFIGKDTERCAKTSSHPKTLNQLAEALVGLEAGRKCDYSPHFLWLVHMVGLIAWVQKAKPRAALPIFGHDNGRPLKRAAALANASEIVREALALLTTADKSPEDEDAIVWLVNRNRPATMAVQRSSLAVKADAARRLFNISCKEISWAVIDSGIDATHPAFLDQESAGRGQPICRVVESYDFTRVRDLLNPNNLTPGALKKLPGFEQGFCDPTQAEALQKQLPELKRHLLAGREVDWNLLSPFLSLPKADEADYRAPINDHGTHVAGILAADWRKNGENEPGTVYLQGVCPDIRLYDLRVLDDSGSGDEFSVIAALQFIRHLNAQHDFIVIHGVNLSLSIQHDVANYACGRTPVCEESERLVASGVVVVAAAGNQGYLKYQTASGLIEGYHTVSITDPGNAEVVITVGSTHRFQPHAYGVSYFSSRGPTGDGRRKPDLVAPGEKIKAPVPGEEDAFKDGTSMAAPHVSGAAALLMARHSELIGKPNRIKKLLCDNATDLGREPYFQGHGMLDALRALQAE